MLDDGVSDAPACSRTGFGIGSGCKGCGNGDVGLVEVGDVEDKCGDASGVDEPEAGVTAKGSDGCETDPVQSGICSREGLVDRVSTVEVVGVVVT